MTGFESLLAGRALGDRYRIIEVIGRGGMGAVYRATDEKLDRTVAVKVIAAPVPTAEARSQLRRRFQREAQAAASLRHANLVTVHDYGTDSSLDLDYLVMELLEGEDLASHIDRGGFRPPATSTFILHESARGLAAGHRAGLIHRDVKPGNIFLCAPDGEEGIRVLVLDFGIAVITNDRRTITQLTQFGHSLLSPAYASPEQLRGEPLTASTDVFSLAATGYHLLTGSRLPTTGDPTQNCQHVVKAFAHARARGYGYPESLERVLCRGLAGDPAERFHDAGEFAKALDEVRREDRFESSPSGATLPSADAAPRSPHVPQAAAGSTGAATEINRHVQQPEPTSRAGVRGGNRRTVSMIGVGTVAFLAILLVFWLAEPSDSDSPLPAAVEDSTVAAGDWLVVLGSYSKQQRMQAEQLVDRLDDAGYRADRANRTMGDPSVADTRDWRDRVRIQDSDLHPALRNGYWVVVMGPYQKAHAEAVARDLDQRLKLGAYIKSGVQ